jgi:monoamine oxidase
VTDVETEVVVVGAGLAGLSAARRLDDRGADVHVLEARDRVGGRTLSEAVGDETVDLGAQWIGPDQEHVHELVEDLGIETFDQYVDGEAQFRAGGELARHDDAVRALSLPAQLNLLYAIRKLNGQSRQVPLDAPHEAPEAEAWDAMTVATWRDSVLKLAAARDAFDAIFRALFTSEPRELSYLYFLFYLNAGGGFASLTSVEGGAQQTRLVGGTQQLSQGLAGELGDRVHLGVPVYAIDRGDGVTVHVDGLTATGEYAVVAVPPALAGRITYDPPLPAWRDGLTQRTPMGSVVKCVAAYEEPFWRAAGLSGEVVDAEGPVGLVYDDSPPDGSSGALVGFALGDDGRALADAAPEERRAAVLSAFADYFGRRAADPEAYADRAWANEAFSRGCYAGNMGPGTLSSYGDALRRPVGRLHWAGTETAEEWHGYMDGAIASGKRAATGVLDRLA